MQSIQLQPSIFYDVMAKLGSVEQSPEIAAMIASHTCFKEELQLHPKHHGAPYTGGGGVGGGNGGGRGGGNHHHHPRQHLRASKRPVRAGTEVSYEQKVIRETISLLNKVNCSNFDVLSGKLIKYCEAGNIGIIVKLVLHKCVVQEFYSGIFFKLLGLIHAKHSILETCQAYGDEIINAMPSAFTSLHDVHQTEYDAYCGMVAAKKTLVAQHLTLLQLRTQGYCAYDLREHARMLLHYGLGVDPANAARIDAGFAVANALLKRGGLTVAADRAWFIGELRAWYKEHGHAIGQRLQFVALAILATKI